MNPPIAPRLAWMDGLRGVAIASVVGFHVYARWPGLMPFGDRYASFLPFKAGWMGVELFFMISGFVILMTLERCQGIGEFLRRRWLRLFPAMLLCALLIVATAPLVPARPAGQPSMMSLLPALTFVSPDWWRWVGLDIAPLEWSFWSLYVEFRFYVFAALVYFWKGSRAVVVALAAAYALMIACWAAEQLGVGGPMPAINALINELSFYYFIWFAAGAAFYLHTRTGDRRWFRAGVGLGLVGAVFVRGLRWEPAVVATLVPLLFALAVSNRRVQWLLERRAVLALGFISYPLYLLHENFVVGATVRLATWNLPLPDGLLPLLPLAAVCGVAALVARYGEPAVRSGLRRLGAAWAASVARTPSAPARSDGSAAGRTDLR